MVVASSCPLHAQHITGIFQRRATLRLLPVTTARLLLNNRRQTVHRPASCAKTGQTGRGEIPNSSAMTYSTARSLGAVNHQQTPPESGSPETYELSQNDQSRHCETGASFRAAGNYLIFPLGTRFAPQYGKRHEGSFGPSTGWRYEYQPP